MNNYSRKMMLFALSLVDYNKKELARILGIKYSTVQHWYGYRVKPNEEHYEKLLEFVEQHSGDTDNR